MLINHVDASVYEYFSEAQVYDAALQALRSVFNKPVNEIFARYLLGECKQQPGQSLDDYHQALKMLSRDVILLLFRPCSIEKKVFGTHSLPVLCQMPSDNGSLKAKI